MFVAGLLCYIEFWETYVGIEYVRRSVRPSGNVGWMCVESPRKTMAS